MIFSGISDIEKLCIVLAILLLASLVVFITITFVLSFHNENKFERLLKESTNSLRVYVIDLKNDVVYYFNRINLKERKTLKVTEFYNHFAINEREDLMTWINSLVDKEKEDDVMLMKEAHVPSKSKKRLFLSLLQVEKIDYKKSLIFIDSYLLKTNNINKKNKFKENSDKFSTVEQFNKVLLNNTTNKGMTFIFNFYNRRNPDEEFSHLIFAQIKNIFGSHANQFINMIEYQNHQIVVSDIKAVHHANLMQLITILKSEINSFLMVSSLHESTGFTIAALENKYFYNEPDKLLNTLVNLSESAVDENVTLLWYEEGKVVTQSDDNEAYRTEVERIIKDKRLKFMFRAIFDFERMKVLGYQVFVEPQDSFFGSIDELKTYASRTDDDRALFATIARNAITRFSQEKDGDDLRLFISINNNERNYVNRTLAHIQNIKTTHVVLIYLESDLVNLGKENDSAIINEIRTFKSKGYEVALQLDDNELTLLPSIYECFDFFISDVDSNLSLNDKNAQKSLMNFRNLIERLLRFHKPIITTNISTWNGVELMNKLGINLISSDAIAPMDENILPVSAKSIMKIKNIKN